MQSRHLAVGIVIVLLVLAGIAAGTLWLGVLTGKAIAAQEESDTETRYDARGFIGVCGEEECVTVPTLLERQGERWRLGFYEEAQEAEGEPRLAYRNAAGNVMTVEEAFGG